MNKLMLACVAFWPVGVMLVTCIATPGYIIPFCSHPVAQLAMGIAFIWLVIGYLVMLRCNRTWQISLAVLLFTMPAGLVPMLGPAVLTIATAIGPSM
jgi:hypothetical protein